MVGQLKVGDVAWYVGGVSPAWKTDGRELVRVVDVHSEFAEQEAFYTVANGDLRFHAWPDDMEPWDGPDVTDNVKVEQWLG